MINFILAHLNRAGGIETATVSTANELAKQGKKVRIFTTAQVGDEILPVYNIDEKIEIVHLRMSRAMCLPDMYLDEQLKKKRFWAPLVVLFAYLTMPIRIPVYKRRFNKIVKKGEQVIISCNEGLFITSKKTKNLFWMHFAADKASWERKFAFANKGKLAGLIMMTETDANFMKRNNLWKNKEILHALNMTRYKLPFDATHKKSKLVFAGRIAPQKDPLKLVDFAKELKAKNNDFVLEIYGDGTNAMKKKLINKIEKHNVQDYVKYMGRTNDVSKVMSEADGLVLISRLEGLPMVVQEAKICSCVPMVLNWGANTGEAVADGNTGIVANSISELVDKIAHLLDDKEKLATMKKNAYENGKLTYPENVIKVWNEQILK